MKRNIVKDTLLGIAIGDALGVPVEFKSRMELEANPVTDFIGYGAWNQPPGTWSDDSSLTFCLAETLCEGYNLREIAESFIKWFDHGYWGAHHKVFDVGNTTRSAINRLKKGQLPTLSGDFDEFSNGNGSLMRILPLLFYLKDKQIEERFKITQEVSGITHMHFRSVFACFIYLEFCLELLKGVEKKEAYQSMKQTIKAFISDKPFNEDEIRIFDRILKGDVVKLKENEIRASGYVIHTLEASLWCFLNANSYAETVLTAVNLGEDTDTTGAVAGGLAGLFYGSQIPEKWISGLARSTEIIELSEKLFKKYFLNLNT